MALLQSPNVLLEGSSRKTEKVTFFFLYDYLWQGWMLIPGFVSWSLPPGLHKQLALGGITMLGWEMSSLPTGRSAPAGSRVLNMLQASCSSPDDGALFLF